MARSDYPSHCPYCNKALVTRVAAHINACARVPPRDAFFEAWNAWHETESGARYQNTFVEILRKFGTIEEKNNTTQAHYAYASRIGLSLEEIKARTAQEGRRVRGAKPYNVRKRASSFNWEKHCERCNIRIFEDGDLDKIPRIWRKIAISAEQTSDDGKLCHQCKNGVSKDNLPYVGKSNFIMGLPLSMD